MLRLLAKLLKVLNSEANPSQISLGLAAGLILGLTPLWSLHNGLLLLLVFLLRVNLSAFFVAFLMFSGFAYLLDPWMERLGESLLTAASLQGLWTSLYQSDFWRLTHFNNTLTLGSLVYALVLAVPLFFLGRLLVVKYRAHILAWVEKFKLVKLMKASRFYRIYESLSGGVGS